VERTKWQVVLEKEFDDQFASSLTEGWTEPESRHPAYADSTALLFCHSDGGEYRWKKKADDVNCHIILVRRGPYRYPPERNAKGNLHGCWWIPDDFMMTLRPPRLQEWIAQVKAGQIHKIDWSLLQLIDAEYPNEATSSVQSRRESVRAFAAAILADLDEEFCAKAARKIARAFRDDPRALDGFFISGQHHEHGAQFCDLVKRVLRTNLTQERRTECKALLRNLKQECLPG
jgi:hypothetical protein